MGRHFLLPFHKDGPVSPLLKEVIKEALKLLPLVYGQLKTALTMAAKLRKTDLWNPRVEKKT